MNAQNINDMDAIALSLEDFNSKLADEYLVVDTRAAGDFTAGFIPGSVFIGRQGKFIDWMLTLIPLDQPLVLIIDAGAEDAVLEDLVKAGYSKVAGYLAGGYSTWKNASQPIDIIIDIESDEMAMDLPFDNRIQVVDVREPNEFVAGHVKNALNLPLSDMADIAQIAGFDEDQSLYIHCAGGYRSVIAASLLKRQGFHDLRNIVGGYKAISQEPKITIEKDTTPLN